MGKEYVYVEPDYSSDKFHIFLERFMFSLFPFTTGLIFWLSIANANQSASFLWMSMIIAFFIGYIFADFLSGIVHWAADTYGSPDTPVLGPNFIMPFRWHHIKPRAMCEYSFVGTIGNSCILGVGVQLLVLLPLSFIQENVWVFCIIITINFGAIATVLANQFHKWAHLPQPPKIAILLQKMRIILGPEHHSIHHTSPFDTYYCVTSGWCNYVLHKIDFWSKAEKFLSYLGVQRDNSSLVSPQTVEIVPNKLHQ